MISGSRKNKSSCIYQYEVGVSTPQHQTQRDNPERSYAQRLCLVEPNHCIQVPRWPHTRNIVAAGTIPQRDPAVFLLAKCFFLRPGVPCQCQKPHMFRKIMFVGLAAEDGKAKKTLCSSRCVVFCPWYPRPRKNGVAKKHFGLPLNSRRYIM